ncbi:carboxylating nicotinate-nucleotide diphosphorylase [Gluconacetobacter azotocaptans]|uniref:Probable nicotinate-nucleotide pyrophosphorylase [carboxylating] n=1 Tax=Gluconacetobacter azotocaptans TaxID=142834 RepID=A0A7W4PI83_9PROT|nr:carboxylating nicotinate-nucleotide diphosphorylase [Gluconacetobacter azotocaptans]MBB2191851.1 carboxylating nicotinate-nucleotide diphosphorylase [Gluconacetobacter azotocaptans]GBQ33314.1 nicotinate-nucleotide pyrophosphorylase [Gluconacetobacter azotocaptans DSM 13594]
MTPLPDLMLEPLVRAGLLEDFGCGGDLTTDALATPGQILHTALVARQDGVVAGLSLARLAFTLIDPAVRFTVERPDGSVVAPGTCIARVVGPAPALLGGERVALNFLSHLSGIATATAEIVRAVAGTRARVCCTRKTLPGMRAIQKYAVRAGGGSNHRFRLDDAILIKDNHIALAGGSVRAALDAARARAGHLVSIELEVDTLDQLAEALQAGGADVFLLDNMTPAQLREAVAMVAGRALTEASGGITPDTAAAIAATGVDILSLGWLTHTVRALDIGLDYDSRGA